MFVALDKDGNRIYAVAEEHYKECFCLSCGEPLIHKRGRIRIHHFAHKDDSACPYGKDADNKSEWHRHMQDLFPREACEVRFKDEHTGEIHIADVYLDASKTVIEFQHSPISPDEFLKRTEFHISAGRRIVWVFDEVGRIKRVFFPPVHQFYENLRFRWSRPRKVLGFFRDGDDLQSDHYSVCLYCGEAQDVVHRIVGQTDSYKNVVLSLHPIILSENMDSNEFFLDEFNWSPWKELIAAEQYEKARLAESVSGQGGLRPITSRPRRRRL